MPTPTSSPAKAPQHHCEVGDEVFFSHRTGAACGKVISHGQHGVVLEVNGKRGRVKHERLLGHKTRVQPKVKVVHYGEDGFLTQDAKGRQRFIADPVPADPMLKASPAGRPGLTRKQITDKNGHVTTRYVRTGEEPKKDREPAKQEPQGYGAHNVKPGHKVKFRAGAFEGEGHVVGKVGKHGAHVKDHTGRTHRVLHSEITGIHGEAAPKPAEGELFAKQVVKGLPKRTKQPHNTWEALVENGQQGMAQFTEALNSVAEQLGLQTGVKDLSDEQVASPDGFLMIAPLKGEQRARQKVETEYKGQWSQVRDLIRGTIAVSSMADLEAAVRAVEASGLTLAQKPKDKFAKPTPEGYRDLNTIVKLPNGMVAELQYHLKPITAAKATAHKDYEITRGLQAKYGEEAPSEAWSDDDHATFHEAVKRQRDVYDAAWAQAQKAVDKSTSSE